MIVYTSSKEKVTLEDAPLASGGEGEIRQIISCPVKYGTVCAKLYFKPHQTVEKEKKIQYMVDNPPKIIVGKGSMLAWPVETLYTEQKDFIGFLMPMAFPDSKKLVILTPPKLKASLKIEWAKFDKERNLKMALISRMKLVNNIAIPIHCIHETNKYVLKDFKPDNVLVTPTGKVSIVDMDSIQICDNGKLLFEGSAATLEYIPPEFYKGVGQNKNVPLDKSWDNFAISVVFYQLIFGLHPYVCTPVTDAEESHTISYCISENLFPFGNNNSRVASYPKLHENFKVIPEPVRQLFIRAFDNKPDNRPSAMEWGKTIRNAMPPDPVDFVPPEPPAPPKQKQKQCPHCGSENEYEAIYCWKCGKSMTPKQVAKTGGKGCSVILFVAIAISVILSVIIGNL